MKYIFLLFLIVFPSIVWGDANSSNSQLLIGDINGTNAGRYRSLKFTNGSTTNNSDGSISVATGGSSGWTLTDGSNTVTGVTQVTVTGGTVGGSTPNATLLITGGSSQWNNGPNTSINYFSGNVGIGTVTVPKQLTIGSTGQATVDSSGNFSTSGTYTSTNNGSVSTPAYVLPGTGGSGLYNANTGDNVSLEDNGVRNIVLDANGNVGVGPGSSAANTLDVERDWNGTTISGITNSSNGSSALSFFQATNGSGILQMGVVGSGYNVGTSNLVRSQPFVYGSSSLGMMIGAGGPLYFSANGQTSNQAILTAAGNVGIGSLNPGQVLDVSGTVRMTGFIMNTSPSSGYVLTSNSSGNGSWTAPAAGGSGTVNSGTSGQAAYYASSTTAVSGTNNMIINGSNTYFNQGNLGIGTLLSTNKLDVAGGLSIGTTYAGYQTAPTNGISVQGNVGIGTWKPGSLLDIEGGNVGIGSINAGLALDVNGGGRFLGSGNSSFGSNVGIGTATPSFTLEVEGNVGIGTAVQGSSGTKVLIYGGNIGIGTANPGVALDVKGDIRDNDFAGQAAGTIMCVKTGGAIGYCSGVIAGVACTCN